MIAQKSPRKKTVTASLSWEGRKLPMELTPSGWRVRSRSRHFPIDYSTNILSLKAAQDDAKEELQRRAGKAAVSRGKKTLEDVVTAYKAMPKRASEVTEYSAISHLRGVVRTTLGKELDQVKVSTIDAKFWLAYIAKRQGREVADLSTRDPINRGINSGINNALCVFKPSLLPLYAEHGITFAPDVATVQWLAVPKLPKPPADDDALIKAWKALRGVNDGLWAAVGAARFVGLRRKEVMGFSKSWVEFDGAATYVRVRDRPEEGFRHKTGESYRALVVNPEYAEFLRNAPDGHICQPDLTSKREKLKHRPNSRQLWFWCEPQKWLKKFTGESKAPLHRMRSLYLDEVAKLTEDAVKAKLAGIKAAADAAGHTSTKTTTKHYLSARP